MLSRLGFGVILASFCLASAVRAQLPQPFADWILHTMKPDEVALRRSDCAMGRVPKQVARDRADVPAWPDASAWCVTVLTRLGRDGTLGYVRDPGNDQPAPAISFDSGFVGGYLKHETLPAGAPSMATLLPIAERCLEQREPDGQLCSSAGYMIGLRAASGEILTVR